MARRILIAGGGVAALEAMLALRALLEERVELELLAPEPHFWYRPLSVAEPFDVGEARHYELSALASRVGATFTLGALEGIDASGHEARTSVGSIPYDVLLVAAGALPVDAVEGALTFRGPADTDRIRTVLHELATGKARHLAFAVPWGAAWSLPLYELALMTSSWLGAHGVQGVDLALVTPDERPLEVFGRAGSDAVQALLDERGIELVTSTHATDFADGRLRLVPRGSLEVDRVIALPRLRAPRLDGLPQTLDGFVPIDAHARVEGLGDVYAAGDITNFPIKQGGIATQQADAAAEAIAARLGAEIRPEPFRPVLRGLLLTGGRPRYLRRELDDDGGGYADPEPLWWPPAKIVGRHLAPFLAELEGVAQPSEPDGVLIDVEVTAEDLALLMVPTFDDEGDDSGRIGELALADLIVARPDDLLGDIAARMRSTGAGSAAVVADGRLVGILTSRDLLRALAVLADLATARVAEWMTADPVALPAETGVSSAVATMEERDIHNVLVLDGERPVGALGYREAVRALRRRGIGLGF